MAHHTVVTGPVGPISDRQPGYGAYEIDIEEILRQSLPKAFEDIEPAPLTIGFIENIPARAKGAYLLFFDGRMVYAGKTDTRHGFRDRLKRHVESVQFRVGLDPDKMTFKALRIMVFSAFDVESILILEMRRLDKNSLEWNDSGFGSNDPGKKRDDGEPASFDRQFPIDIDLPLKNIAVGAMTISSLLRAAKASVPYLPRHGPVTGYGNIAVAIDVGIPTMRSILNTIASSLPGDFQITVFDGRIILYRERREYEFARKVIRGRL